MKRILGAILATGFSTSLFAYTTCYKLSMDGRTWSRTSEELCVSKEHEESNVQITLHSRELSGSVNVATFNLQEVGGYHAGTENKSEYGVANPSNSIFNALKIRFDGVSPAVSFGTRFIPESGRVWIGQNVFHYSKIAR